MSNTDNNLQTQTSNALHNAIMEAGGKDRPPMLAHGNYVQWKSIIKRYIDTKPNNELIHYCLQNPPYKFKWTEKTVPIAEGSLETTTEGYIENYKNVSQDIRDYLNAEAKVVQIILTGIDNDIYSTVDACLNAYEMWKAIERLKQEWQRFVTLVKQSQELKGKAIVNYSTPTYDQEPAMVAADDEITSSNTSRANQDNSPRINRRIRYDNQRVVNVAGARETIDTADNSGPIFDTEPLQKVQNDDDNYNVFANDQEHPVQPKSVNDTYMVEQGDTNITIDSLDMSTNEETVDQDDDDDDDLANERDLLASLINKLKCEIDDSKNRN
ncbi:hypothetical protein Tco_0752471 [Tanacetum coccineum]|uniref:Gag protein n=1 Tax=Tanacetum coccineum TaxID=301880 RepID=A0ABQ4ZA59_9ASTR